MRASVREAVNNCSHAGVHNAGAGGLGCWLMLWQWGRTGGTDLDQGLRQLGLL